MTVKGKRLEATRYSMIGAKGVLGSGWSRAFRDATQPAKGVLGAGWSGAPRDAVHPATRLYQGADRHTPSFPPPWIHYPSSLGVPLPNVRLDRGIGTQASEWEEST